MKTSLDHLPIHKQQELTSKEIYQKAQHYFDKCWKSAEDFWFHYDVGMKVGKFNFS